MGLEENYPLDAWHTVGPMLVQHTILDENEVRITYEVRQRGIVSDKTLMLGLRTGFSLRCLRLQSGRSVAGYVRAGCGGTGQRRQLGDAIYRTNSKQGHDVWVHKIKIVNGHGLQ